MSLRVFFFTFLYNELTGEINAEIIISTFSCEDDNQLNLMAQTASSAHSVSSCVWRNMSVKLYQHLEHTLWLISCWGHPVAQSYSIPDGCCPEPVWWHHVSPCFLYCRTHCNPQEEDSVPPRPPLPQSYEPNPPTVPPMPSHAGVRPSSLHKPEDRKANHRNSTHSVSLLTTWLTLPSAVSSHVRADDFHFDFHKYFMSFLDCFPFVPVIVLHNLLLI